MNFFEKNIEVIKEHHPQLADVILSDREEEGTVRVTAAQSGEARVIFTKSDGEEVRIHSAEDPVKCARQAMDLLDKSEKEGIFVLLGFGLGYLAEELLKHFETGHAMLIYEATPLLFKTALRARDLTRVFASDKVRVVVGEDGDDFSIIHNYHHHIVNGKFWVVAHEPSKRLNEGAYERFRNRLEDEKRITLSGVATAIGLGKNFVNTFLQNVPSLLHKPGVTSLKNVFEGRPAIVVAAGPSLDRNLHLLKKAKSRALIVAVDASLPALVSAGIIPDVCVAIDPLSDNVGLFRDNPRLKEIPFVCLAQYTPDIVKMYPGPLFMNMVEGNIVYQWLRGYWEEKGCIACFGGSVSHLAFAMAEFMGASTICLTGLDLSFEEKLHAGDATSLLAPEGVEVPDYRIGADTAQDIFGEKRYTLQTFLTFRTSFENRIKSFPGLVLNATEGGLPVAGAENIRLTDFIEEFCDLPEIDTFKILSGVAETEVGYNIEGLLHEIKETRDAFSRIRKHSLDILKCIRKIKVLRKEKKEGDEFHRTLDRIERLTEKVRSPILNIIASYHYQLELYLKKQEMQDMDDIEDRWERLDAQLGRGLNYYGELVEAIQLFMRQLDALATGLERERKICAVLGDTRLSEGVRLVRAGREYRRLGLATQAVRYLEQGVQRARSGGTLPGQEAAKSTPAIGEVLDAQLDLADTYITQFRFYEARAVLDETTRVTDSRARDKRTEKLLALCKDKIRAWEERERRVAAGLAKAKTEYGGHLDSGGFYFRTKNFVRAKKAYTLAVEESRLLADAHQADGASCLVAAYYGLAHTHLKLKENEKAVDAFASALQADPANPLIYRDLALLAIENGNHDSGEMFLKKALELAPWSDELYSLLARLYLGLGETQKAIALYESGVQLNPQNANFQKELALLYQDVINQGAEVKTRAKV
jgi:hypothetical protein